jgi:RNA polymerase sigma-70 factor (ECF subfamily)
MRQINHAIPLCPRCADTTETERGLLRIVKVGTVALLSFASVHEVARVTRAGVQGRTGRSGLDAAMDRYAGGDDEAFAEVYDALAPRLYGFLLRQTRQHAKAEDLVQLTFMKIHGARGTFIEGADVVPWAFAIARRLFIDDLRRGGREVLHGEAKDADNAEAAFAPDPPADERIASAELGSRIHAELALLPETQRAAFRLIKEEGLSVAEAARVLGTTVSAVKLRAHRAYLALRAALGDAMGKEEEP